MMPRSTMEADTRRVILGFIVMIWISSTCTALLNTGQLTGRLEACTNEGEEVPVDNIKEMGCFKCKCKNYFVVCEPQTTCPGVDDCYMLEKKRGCCEKCKECVYEGERYASGAEWTSKTDPCSNLKCVAGVVTVSNLQCYTPCENPLPARPGQCCPTCAGCNLNGQHVIEGREVSLSEDPCLKCSCSSGKRLTCAKRACPILQCPASKQIRPSGECCPRCAEKRTMTQVPGKCILGKGFHSDGKHFMADHCSTSCTCTNGTSVCRRQTCPVLECKPELQTMGDDCCLHCPIVALAKSTCIWNGTEYQLNETWNLSPCASCICTAGDMRCVRTDCPITKCKANEALVTTPGQCCARCEESAGTCTVFGDPHYKTFDGKFFSFKGSCKYQLAADCRNHSFSIRVTNDGRNTTTSAWTKTVTLKLGTVKVNLGQKMRVKVNGSRVILPYRLGSTLNIQQTPDGVAVFTNVGIQLLWDGSNFLQVEALAKFKNSLCGLCGNFNGLSRDDLVSRQGIRYPEDEVWRFANSWKVGGPKACARKRENLAKPPMCRHKKGAQFCRPLEENELFEACTGSLNPWYYFKSCEKDMCECPSGKCYCDSFSAYARECARLGVQLPDWKTPLKCDAASIESATKYSIERILQQKQQKQRERKELAEQQAHHFLAQQKHKRRKKTQTASPDFFSQHIPKTFLIQKKTNGRAPPPIH